MRLLKSSGINTIVLNDVAVSGVHTKIVKKANGRYTLLDSASTNGTFVNGAEQRAIDLKHGDQIRIGGCTLAFEEHRGSGILQAGSGEGAIAWVIGQIFDAQFLGQGLFKGFALIQHGKKHSRSGAPCARSVWFWSR